MLMAMICRGAGKRGADRGELQRCAANICRFLMSVPCMDRDPREQERVELQKAGAQAPEGFAENIPVLRDSEAYTMDLNIRWC